MNILFRLLAARVQDDLRAKSDASNITECALLIQVNPFRLIVDKYVNNDYFYCTCALKCLFHVSVIILMLMVLHICVAGYLP